VSWWREPVLHFMILGAAIFSVDALFSEPEDSGVLLPDAVGVALEADFVRRMGRVPDPQERATLEAGWVDEELLFREGRRLGLERGDPIVRRRVIQRMKALQRTMYPVDTPEDDALLDWMETHADRYQRPARASFEHLFSSGRHPDAKARALQIQRAQRAGDDKGAVGDPFPHGPREASMSIADVERQFGRAFSDVVSKAVLEKWTLAPSEFGWHVIRVGEREPAGPADLEDVREAVEQDWMLAQERQVEREALQRLRESAGL